VIVVNQAFVDKYLPGEEPIGKKIAFISSNTAPPQEIIGVVENIRESSLDDETWPTLYGPNADSMPSLLLVRTEVAPDSMIPTLTAALRKINANIATSDYQSMTERINSSRSAYIHRSSAALVGGFAATALLLSVVGLYGVIAYSVGQRTREIGIRMALGARRESIYRLVLTEAGWLVVFGVIAGIVGAALTSKMMRSLLFGVGSWDLHTFAGVVLVLAVAAMFASFFPARRAASVDPMNVLRTE
jgi:ABC-type antimicrobial peptide transport system permease subunit